LGSRCARYARRNWSDSLFAEEKYLCLKKMIAQDITENNMRIRRTAFTIYPALRISCMTELFMDTPDCFREFNEFMAKSQIKKY
jgi:hypothetical protein